MIKTLLGLLRYSAHDPDVFYNFQSVWTAQLTAPFIGPRGESDVLRDLEVHKEEKSWVVKHCGVSSSVYEERC